MIRQVFAVYDEKASVFMTPLTFVSAGEAIREFETAVRTGGTQFNRYPRDFKLFRIGAYDDNNGKLTSVETPTLLASGADYEDAEQFKEGGNPNVRRIG